MKILTVVVILIFTGTIRRSNADLGCMYGWRLNSDSQQCEIDCKDPLVNSGDKWNVYCEAVEIDRYGINYNATRDKLIMAKGRSLASSKASLPPCYNTTLKKGTYTVSQEGIIQVKSYYFLPTSGFDNTNNADNVRVCYPLSPQLLQCQLHQAFPSEYYVEHGVKITIPNRNFTAYLGDYYINKYKIAFTCAQTISRQLYDAPRCNYVILNSDDYKILRNGSIYIPYARLTINNPVYSVEYGHVTRVCIPLSFDFLNCPHRYTRFHSYIFNRDMTASETNVFKNLEPNDEYVDASGQINFCATSDEKGFHPVSIVIYFYLIICVVAGMVILLTVVVVVVNYKRNVTNNHKLCMLLHIVFLLMVYILFMITRFYSKKYIWQCYLLFSFNYFSNITTMTWLNIIIFDIWQNFKCLHSSPNQTFIFSKFSKSSKVLLSLYSLYAFGLPLTLLIIVIIIDLSPTLCEISFGVCPHIRRNCWFNNVDAYSVFYAIPYTILTMVNLVFLVLTIHILHYASSESELANPLIRKQMRTVIIKLLVLSCFCYVIIAVCFVVDATNTTCFIYSTLIYDAVMIGQGIAIFLIYYQKYLLK
ncbi:hypothetical protein CHUAL_005508 [Chamberlinius hualienensis]